MIQDLPDAITQRKFGIQHSLLSVCAGGHQSAVEASKPQTFFSILCNDVDTTRALCGADATLNDYFEHLVPRRPMGNDTGGTKALHTLPSSMCSHPGCDNESTVYEIETAWPDILNVCPETVGSGPGSFSNRRPLPLPRQLDVHGVQYELVGRAHYNGGEAGHFTCDRLIHDRLYASDDLHFEGSFVDVGDVDILEEVDFTVQVLVYRRCSEQTVCDSKMKRAPRSLTRYLYRPQYATFVQFRATVQNLANT